MKQSMVIFIGVAFAFLVLTFGTAGADASLESEGVDPMLQSVVNGIDPNDDVARIGAFNIQIFGVTKASKPEVMDVLAKIIRTYDVVAIQEIRDISQESLPALVDEVNADGSQYSYVVSERLGRTSSKEQYAYIYNTQTVKLTDIPHTYPEPDGSDPFHREPYIASFQIGDFDATYIVIHTDPDEATEEINCLDSVVKYAQGIHPEEEDFIVMGDLNADGSYFDEDSSCTISTSDYYWCIDNSLDTTTKSTDYTYDRIIITTGACEDFTGEANVFRYDLEYGLSYEETIAVSDHYPVYADFLYNTISVLKGDFDGDGHVDFMDFLDFVDAYGSIMGDANYDSIVDFDEDGDIDFMDFLVFVDVYGT